MFIPEKLRAAWPDARFIFLLRHPAAIAESRKNWFKGDNYDEEQNHDLIRRYCESLEEARQNYDGLTIRYEDLTEDPESVTKEICRFLEIEWEPEHARVWGEGPRALQVRAGGLVREHQVGPGPEGEAAAARDA